MSEFLRNHTCRGVALVLLLLPYLGLSQTQDLRKVDSLLKIAELEKADSLIQSLNKNSLSEFDVGYWYYCIGRLYKKRDDFPVGLDSLIVALNIFKNLDSVSSKADTDYEIYDLLVQQESLKIDPQPFLDNYLDFARKSEDSLVIARAYSKIAVLHWDKDQYERANKFFRKTIENLRPEDTFRISKMEVNLGSILISQEKPDSALYYYRKTLPYFIKENRPNQIANNYNNQGRAFEILGDTIKAIDLYQKALGVELKEYVNKSTADYLDNIIRCYKTTKNYKSAFESAELLLALNVEIDDTAQSQALIDSERKYRASEKEKQRIQNRNIAYGLGGSLTLGSIIAFLTFRNTKRKQRIAEQEKEIEIQKTEKILKEQEVSIINAMISGQEKERQKLASDLHDNVGATISAARMQFEHLASHKGNLPNADELYEKTQKLLEKAYTDVRGLAHAKNSGVIAKRGLLTAVNSLAKNVSNVNALQIEVKDFGLETRLETSVEITIFRIIQELITNTVKYANATEAGISITQHENTLNIIVEDNGVGFDPSAVKSYEGMGLSSIERRVEHLEGTFTIDSTPGRGTSVLIDIPV